MADHVMLTASDGQPRHSARLNARQLAVLNEVSRIASHELDLRPMLQKITDALAREFGWEFIACVGIEADRFVCLAVTTKNATVIRPGYGRELGSGIVGRVALTGRPRLLDDVREAPDYVETMPGVLSELCVPVIHGGRTVAVINLESTRVGEFHGQVRLVEAIAEQIAGTIENARLYEKLRRRAGHLETISQVSRAALEAGDLVSILDRVTREIHERFAFEVTSLFLLDESKEQFDLASRQGDQGVEEHGKWPATMGVVGRALRLGVPQLVRDVSADTDYYGVNDSVVAEYAIPMGFGGEWLGVLNVESSDAATFDDESIRVLDTLVDQLSGVVRLASMNRRLAETSLALEIANRRLTRANDELHRLSTTDALTGTANRRRFDQVLDVEWRRSLRSGTPLALLMIDVDHFKAYNDGYGHQSGDRCLAIVARSIADFTNRAGDFLSRYGGEEFVIITPGDGDAACALAEAIRSKIESLAIEHRFAAGVITVSVGVASMVPEGESSQLLARADEALYRAKRDGRNRVVASTP